MESATFLVVESVHGEQTHALLKSKGWLNATLESLQTSDGSIGFPLVGFDHEDIALNALRNHLGIEASIVVGETKYRPSVDPHHRLLNAVTTWLEDHDVDAEVNELLPVKWEKLGQLVLFPRELGQTETWEKWLSTPWPSAFGKAWLRR